MIRFVIASGCEISARWLALISIVFAPIRLAMKRSRSGLIGLSDAAVQLIRSAKKRGYVTHDQINSVLPSEEVNSKQIEDVLAMFSGMGGQRSRDQGGE